MSTTELSPQQKSKVIEVENSSRQELFVKANIWMVENFNDAKSVVQFSDKQSGVVTGKFLMASIIRGTEVPRDDVFAIIKINVKDNAAKIEVKSESYINNYNPLAGGESYPLEQANADIDNLIASFEKSMMGAADDF